MPTHRPFDAHQQALCLRWHKYALWCANFYARRWEHIDEEDIISAALEGLCDAVATHAYNQWLKLQIKRCIQFRINSCFLKGAGTGRNQRGLRPPHITLEYEPATHINFDIIEGSLLWDQAKRYLDPKRYEILHRHLVHHETWKDIARTLKVSHQRVGQLYNSALTRLRGLFRNDVDSRPQPCDSRGVPDAA